MAEIGAIWRAMQARLEAVPGLNPAPREAKQMMSELLDIDFIELLGREREDLGAAEAAVLEGWVARREQGEPLAYILGKTWFYGEEWAVGPGVLVPRPDSEILVRAVCERVVDKRPVRVAEVGVGSGALLGSVLHEVADCEGVGSDISEAAAEVARRNLEAHGLAGRARIVVADLLEGVDGPFTLIMSNPPYISDAEWETLEPGVRDFEPRLALTGGDPHHGGNPDGLLFYRRLVKDAPAKLAPGGWLCLETGWQQPAAVQNLLQQEGAATWRDISITTDLAGRGRVVCARFTG